MSELVDAAVTRMLSVFAGRITPDRVEAFTDAIMDEQLCERCAVRACRNVTRGSKRTPLPVNLVEETREEMATADHARHIAERRQLTSGDLGAWWRTEAPALVKKAWPELTGEQAIAIAKEMENLGYVGPEWDAIASDVGFVDETGPTVEREWWLNRLKYILPAEESRYV